VRWCSLYLAQQIIIIIIIIFAAVVVAVVFAVAVAITEEVLDSTPCKLCLPP